MKPNFNEAKKRALNVLRENYLTEPPVLAQELVEQYGLQTKFVKFKTGYENISGFINNKIIYVNTDESAERQNFIIAHELGHFLLGHVNLPEYSVLFRKPLGVQKEPIEQEANVFAANLLVPESMLRNYPNIPNSILARIFGVSVDVIGFRKEFLNIG